MIEKNLQSMSHIEGAFFDIDRTLVASGTHRLHDGLSLVLHSENRQFPFTEVTARGIELYQDVLHKNPELIPSPEYPVGLEYGTHIVTSSDYTDRSCYKSIRHNALSTAERSDFIEFIGGLPFLRIAFYGQDPSMPRTIWLPSDQQDQNYSTETSVVYSESVDVLARALEDAQPGMITVKLRDCDIRDTDSLSLTTHTTSFSDTTTFDFLPANTDKRDAVEYIASMHCLPHESILVAGDSLPDLGMLSLSGVRAVLVRNPKVDSRVFPEHIERVEPYDLADYLRCV